MIEVPQKKPEKPKPKFLLSGMSQAERNDYGALVEQLGGIMSDAPHYDASCSHLVVGECSYTPWNVTGSTGNEIELEFVT